MNNSKISDVMCYGKTLFIFLSLSSMLISCNDVLQEVPESSYSAENIYNTESGLEAGIIGAYGSLRQLFGREGSGAILLGTDLVATKWLGSFRASVDLYAYNAEEDFIYNMWVDHYESIGRANTMIKNAQQSSVDESYKQRIIAEARFIRAYVYWRMAQIWGPVPLVLENVKKEVPRTPLSAIYAQIVKDLEFASQPGVLPVNKPSGQEGRVTQYTAKALLGKVYLTMASHKETGIIDNLMNQAEHKDYGYGAIPQSPQELYTKARDLLREVQANGGYSLLDDYSAVFDIDNKSTNAESIWEIQFSRDVAGLWSKEMGIQMWVPAGWQNRGWAGAANIKPNPPFYFYYSQGDKRAAWNLPLWRIEQTQGGDITGKITFNPEWIVSGFPGYFYNTAGIGKYRWAENLGDPNPYNGVFTPNNIIVLRYADVLLMLAEASLQANGGNAPAEAVEAINQVRNRARGFDVAPSETPEFQNYTTSTLTIDDIIKERALELCFEHTRKFDLWRTGKLDEKLLERKPEGYTFYSGPIDIGEKWYLFPIPQREIDIVSNKEGLFQNPGF